MNTSKAIEENRWNGDETINKELEEIPDSVQKQIESSKFELSEYMEECSQLVTNVLLANDNRENNRRETDRLERDKRLKAVENESEAANSKFKEISAQWPVILKKNDALEIYEQSEVQRTRGLYLIEQKNEMIKVLKQDLAESDSRFLQEQDAQSEDVRILQERIENQVKFIRKQYNNHIQFIRCTIEKQRKQRINKANMAWDDLYNQMILAETRSFDERLAMVDKKEINIMKQYEINEESIRTLKAELNLELHHIQKEFELIKMKCMENVEKLNYNYQVLKRREEEIAYAKAAQRRKMNKLQDVLSIKRRLARETKAEFESKVSVLSENIEKLNDDIERHESKAERFAEIQGKSFRELWDFSQEQIGDLLARILKIDQIVHEEYLGVEWQSPPTHESLKVDDFSSYKNHTITKTENVKACLTEFTSAVSTGPYGRRRERALLKLILEMTLKNCTFLLDDQLMEIIDSSTEKTLSLLYNIMAVCGLNNMYAWNLMISRVKSSVICEVCRGPVAWCLEEGKVSTDHSTREHQTENQLIGDIAVFAQNHADDIEKTLSVNANVFNKIYTKDKLKLLKLRSTLTNTEAGSHEPRCSSFERTNYDSDESVLTISVSLTDFEQMPSENDSATVKISHDSKPSQIQNFRPCDDPTHPLLMTDVDYLKAVKETIHLTNPKNSNQSPKNKAKNCNTNTLSEMDINHYWKQYLNAFPEDRVQLWDVFEKAIKKYYQILHLRYKKITEVEKLEAENVELKRILKQFMDAEQDDGRLQNISTPKMIKRKSSSPRVNNSKSMSAENSTKYVSGTAINILTVDRTNRRKP
ncbi:dynein regulatory complex protein 1 [Adelges cooleyi]|uniref:dynein regulatory complex protein 1 n=1 Tax=Adelges cooleyi TaxID=133065 RepID=UPI00217FBE17|nr:dynein regulatory complex protein 1 [Adelges cooleyi]